MGKTLGTTFALDALGADQIFTEYVAVSVD